MDKKKKYISPEMALIKMQAYCAYQERCHQEVRSKLIEMGVYGDALENIVAELINENFLNEERFAKAYAHGKFNIKKWGKIRIVQELKLRKVSEYSIRKALQEIDNEDYIETLQSVLLKKSKDFDGLDTFTKNNKLAQYALSRGFEQELIWSILKNNTF